jgi:hypothetical protein
MSELVKIIFPPSSCGFYCFENGYCFCVENQHFFWQSYLDFSALTDYCAPCSVLHQRSIGVHSEVLLLSFLLDGLLHFRFDLSGCHPFWDGRHLSVYVFHVVSNPGWMLKLFCTLHRLQVNFQARESL